MRICFVCHSGSRSLGGGERCTIEVVEALRRKGAECLCLTPAAGGLHGELRRRGFVVKAIPYGWWMSDDSRALARLKRLARNLATLPWVVWRIAAWRCDVVYTSTATVWVGAAAARLLGLRHVWHLYEFGVEDHDLSFDWGRRRALRLMDRLSEACVAVSEAIAAHYASVIPRDKLKLVYFAVEEPAEAAADSRAFGLSPGLKCLLVGQLKPKKGQEDAVRAVALLKREGVAATALLAGLGEDAARLEALARELGVADGVRLLGWTDATASLMKAADVVLVCSRQEALGRVAVEAMYAGKPVVGARGGGTPELVRDGFNGLLYSPGDAQDLARRLRFLAEHPAAASEMGAHGRRWALERFSLDKLGDDLWAVLHRREPGRRLA